MKRRQPRNSGTRQLFARWRRAYSTERATIVYANRMREAYKDVPIIIGGIEASLRRFAHYDYWSNKVRHSILLDSKADILSYGMGEHSVVEIADALAEGKTVAEMYDIRGICYVTSRPPISDKTVVCPSYEDVKKDKLTFAKAFKMQYEEQDPFYGKTIIQPSENRFVVQTPPALPLTTAEMDAIYELPFQRRWHPDYDAAGGVPALHEVQFSLTSQRGCFGHCHFCAIASHQGRIIQHRSHESLVRETERMTHLPGFKGYIHDVGGPTANFRHVACAAYHRRGLPQPPLHRQRNVSEPQYVPRRLSEAAAGNTQRQRRQEGLRPLRPAL